jgi:hypothetical protein
MTEKEIPASETVRGYCVSNPEITLLSLFAFEWWVALNPHIDFCIDATSRFDAYPAVFCHGMRMNMILT